MIHNISSDQLRRAARIKDKIDALERKLEKILRDGGADQNATPIVSKRVLSAAARERIAAAQRKRWAALKKAGK